MHKLKEIFFGVSADRTMAGVRSGNGTSALKEIPTPQGTTLKAGVGEILEGEITKLDRNANYGVISNVYRFSTGDIPVDWKKGARVSFKAEGSEESSLLSAKDVTVISNETRLDEEEEASCTSETGTSQIFSVDWRVMKIMPNKIVVGTVNECDPEFLMESTMNVCIGREHLPQDYSVVAGDWLHIRFKGKRELMSQAQVLEVTFTEVTAKTGEVTRKRGHFCIDGSIYFSEDITEKGNEPRLGDKVRFIAVASDQARSNYRLGPNPKYIFKMRAVSMTIEERVNSTENHGRLEEIVAPLNEIRELLLDKGNIKINPKNVISFKTVILGSKSSENVVTIQNHGNTTCFLSRIFSGKIQDLAKFDFDFGSFNREEFLVEIRPHKSWKFNIKCTPLHLGRTRDLIIFDFGTFRVGRWLHVHSIAPGQDQLLHYQPEILNRRMRIKSDYFVESVMVEKEMTVVSAPRQNRSPFFIPHQINGYEVPKEIMESFRDRNAELLLQFYPSVEKELDAGTYKDLFQVSLWFEEIQNELQRREYDLRGVFLRRCDSEDCYSVEVPSLKDIHPPILLGDRVRIYESLNSTEMFEGPIKDISSNDDAHPKVFVHLPEQFKISYDGGPRVVRFCQGRVRYKRMHFAVEQAYKYLQSEWLFPRSITMQEPRIDYFEDGEDNLHPTIHTKITSVRPRLQNAGIKLNHASRDHRLRNLEPIQGNVIKPAYLSNVKLKWYNHNLNEEQKDAVRRILKGQGRPLPYIIFGPPGTGKTITIVEAVLQIFFLEPTSRILVTVPSNAATDLIAERLVATNRFKPGDLVRLNGFRRSRLKMPDTIEDFCEDGEHLDEIVKKRLIISTLVTAGQFFQLSANTGHFSHVFVDEAGYCTEPETLIPCILAAMDKESQVVLVGDPKQLGPVLMCDIDFNKVLERSLLERLMETKVYARVEEVYTGINYNAVVLTKLVRNYRSHPILLKLPSKMFYDDELVPCERNEVLELLNLPFLPKKGVPLIFHGVDGNCNHDIDESPSWLNLEEAWQVIEYVKLLRSNGVSSGDIGIITPYRKQVEKIRQALKMVLGEDSLPTVASVQEFQGGERKVIIISTVRSYTKDIIQKRVSRLDFLYSKKRFNVAITRAKALLIVIGNPLVLSYNTYWSELLHYALELRAYIGCELPEYIGARWNALKSTLTAKPVPNLMQESVGDVLDEDDEEYSHSEDDYTHQF